MKLNDSLNFMLKISDVKKKSFNNGRNWAFI